MSKSEKKSIGTAIDEIISALSDLDEITRSIAVKAACGHLNINICASEAIASTLHPTQNTGSSAPEVQHTSTPQQTSTVKDIRSLKEEKVPSNGIEMTCLVAYYLENYAPEGEASPDINKKDLEKYFKQAGFPLPKAVSQTLIDAKAAGYLDSASSRGRYKLNPVGHNLVAHSLPRTKK
ncbi:MAG: hypothetical protein KBT63_05705 [Porticoccaceae bacterium]|nr:hypothetical protein [Porticoccaceae bacterium]